MVLSGMYICDGPGRALDPELAVLRPVDHVTLLVELPRTDSALYNGGVWLGAEEAGVSEPVFKLVCGCCLFMLCG